MLGTIFTLIGGIRGVAVIALLLALGGWAWTQKRSVEQAELARDQAITQRDMAGVERDKAISAARTNDEAVKKLEQEQRDINTALNDLAAAREGNRANAITREVIIQNQAAVPESSALAALVVREIIEGVQADRVRRRSQ